MKILLIYPKLPDTLYAFKNLLNASGYKAPYPPLGLLTVSAMLPKHYERKLIDLNVKMPTAKDFEWCDYIFLSAMSTQEISVRWVLEQAKKHNKKIVAGGPLFTHDHQRFEEIDHFILNEAEITLPRFIEDLEDTGKTPLRKYATPEFADITKSPIPDFDLVDLSDYGYPIVQYSRGCPYMCDFCDVTALFGRRPRTKTSDRVIEELEHIRKHRFVQTVLFADDNLIGNKKILKKDLLPRLIEWRKEKDPGFFFMTQLTITLADDEELMDLMIDAGFRYIFIGIESPDEETLLHTQKTQNTRRDQIESLEILRRKGFIPFAGFIVGFDTDTDTVFERQLKFINDAAITMPIVNILKAPPGTDLFLKMKNEGRINKDFAFLESETNLETVMPIEQLNAGFEWLIKHLYLPEYTVERIKNFISDYGPVKTSVKIRQRASPTLILRLLRIFYKLGIQWEHRKYFWGLLNWARKNKPNRIDLAFALSLTMYQWAHSYYTIKNQLSHADVERVLMKKSA